MQHSPGPAPLGIVLLYQPLARATELQPRAVHQQVHRLAPRLCSRHLQRLGPSAPRSDAAPGGTPPAASASWRSPDRSRRVTRIGVNLPLDTTRIGTIPGADAEHSISPG